MLNPRVLLLIHNPVIESEGNKRLNHVLGWNDPDQLCAEYIKDVEAVSHGHVRYQVVERVELDEFPVKQDSFVYDDASYLRAMRSRQGIHHPDTADYPALLRRVDFLRKVEANEVDELWMMAFPYAGYYESCMGGRGAIWCNGPVIPGTSQVSRRFVVMGFNFERGVGEMLENLGHRAESIMEHVFADTEDGGRQTTDDQESSIVGRLLSLFGRRPSAVNRPSSVVDLNGNLWRQFIRYDQIHPNLSGCGNVHFAPGSLSDYDWGNRRMVLSNADDWLNYPNFKGESREMNAADWGNGDIREHHRWWFSHFPHVEGTTPAGKLNNWWEYVVALTSM